MSNTQSKPASVWWYVLGGVFMCPVLAVLFVFVAILLIIMLPAVPFFMVAHRRDNVLKKINVAEDAKGKRIAELETAFDLLHEHLDDIIEKERINVLGMDDEFMEKRGKAMRMRHTTLPSERRD